MPGAVIGLPAEEVLRVGMNADMIVVGSRGAGGFAKLLMGSVSSQVAEHARCSVVGIPAYSMREAKWVDTYVTARTGHA